MSDDQPIIVIKKKGGHGGHHGGAWKVAYADFVTAMMSLFIVLWLMNSSKPVQEAVAGYFRDPRGVAQQKGTAMTGKGGATPAPKNDDMAKLKEDLLKALERLPDFNKIKNQIDMTITPEGLRIELIEDAKGTFFENGKAQPTPALQGLLKVLSVEVGKLPNSLSIEGHTDSKPFSDSQVYGNWELSTDRANIARRLMESSGLRKAQVVQVRGYADHNLRKPLQPEDASNRRITVVIQYGTNSDHPTIFTSDGSVPPPGEQKDAPEPAAKATAATPKEGKQEK